MEKQTIVAISTPPGEGAISIIRLSGSAALQIAATLSSDILFHQPSHQARLHVVHDLQGKRLDQALILVMRAPHSYTGDDLVEIHAHGGMVVSRKILEACMEAGARMALPGEFTFQAFMNGKIDLLQAEAVLALIGAKNEQALAAANQHLSGRLSHTIQHFRKELTRLAAMVEASVDFPEEGLIFSSEERLSEELAALRKTMTALLETFHEGKKLQEGISLCIAGPPNAGKSSLMNALLGQERAIVTPIAGTTRDRLEAVALLKGLHFNLIDTAGIRESNDPIEQEGIRRSKQAVAEADLVLLVLDASSETHLLEPLYPSFPHEKTIVLWNKVDLGVPPRGITPFSEELCLSVKEKTGLNDLMEYISERVWTKGIPAKDELFITTLRHKDALSEAIDAILQAEAGLKNQLSPEFLTLDLRTALSALSQMTGGEVSKELLDSIFNQFCLGK